MYIPECEKCAHYQDCAMRIHLAEARETLFNIGREASGRKDYIYKGKIIKAEADE